SRDGDLARLADGTGAAFAVWEVMGRDAHQIWLRDRWGATMSWLAAEPVEARTRLLFGSLVAARTGRMPLAYRLLLPGHRVYARALLRSAARRLPTSNHRSVRRRV
ncbi:MAG: hypothetical protein AAGE03_18200, partial [Pseudomonadota bacterium]